MAKQEQRAYATCIPVAAPVGIMNISATIAAAGTARVMIQR